MVTCHDIPTLSLSLTHKTHGNYAPCFIFQKVVPWYLHVTDAT